MARRGENIYKRKDSRWEGRYIQSYDIRGNAKYGYVYAPSYSEVRKKLADAKTTKQVDSVHNGTAFGNYCDEWLTLNRCRVKNSTYVKYHNMINRHIKPALGSYSADHLNTMAIEHFSYMLLNTKKLSSKTVKDILTVLKSIIKYAGEQSDSKLSDIKIVYPKEMKEEMRILTVDEQNRLISHLAKDMDTVKFGILLALFTGMRIGEICALRWGDISLENKLIHINKTMQRLQTLHPGTSKKTRVVIGDTKSSCSDRYIPITDRTAALCDRMYVTDPNAYILTGISGKYMEPRALQYRLGKILTACNLKGIHFHTLRHTFATRCIEVGFEIKSLSEILGHSNTKVTLDRYIHSSMELKRLNMVKLSSLVLPSQVI